MRFLGIGEVGQSRCIYLRTHLTEHINYQQTGALKWVHYKVLAAVGLPWIETWEGLS